MAAEKKTFKDELDPESLKAFSEVAKRPFSEQAIFFMNAFWAEFGDQADVIYHVHWEIFKMADRRAKNVQYIHLYEEGFDLDFDLGLYVFEQLCKFFAGDLKDKTIGQGKDGKWWAENYPKAVPQMQTSIVRKKELRDTVDVNFDGRISMLEYLLYQFEASPKMLMERSAGAPDESEELRLAREALDAVNAQILAYETERARLIADSELPGVKGLKAKNELAQLDSSPLAEKLRYLLIKAEAAVRKASKNSGGGGGGGSAAAAPSQGAIWWLNSEVETKKNKYGSKK